MAKRSKKKDSSASPPQETIGLVTAPRGVMNLAILVGGAIGLVIQAIQGMNAEGAFVVTALCCFGAVFAVNVIWLIKTRRAES